MIDVRKLEILRELDRCGTIAATALAVHLTPSAVSQQLATLSREAGTPMLEPDGRRVRLTEAAQLLLSHAHQIFTHLEHAESDLAAFRRGDAGTVRLGTFSSAVKAHRGAGDLRPGHPDPAAGRDPRGGAGGRAGRACCPAPSTSR